MTGENFMEMEEIDCGSFFDQIEDLIEFPPVTDTSLNSVDCNDFPNMWTNNSDELQVSDPIFCGSNSDSASALSAELAVPYEDIVQLEWLSNFVEDSFSGGGLTIPVAANHHHHHHQFQTTSPVSVLESSSSSSSSSSGGGGGSKMIPLSPIQRGPQRARTKRARPTTFNPRSMVDLLSPLLLGGPLSNSSESENNFGPSDQMKKKKMKKPKIQPGPMGPPEENESETQNQNQGVRKCLHCEITKTPQWRAGPLGPKTLCNACGVRYKSGRLFPEYRPAASPTFVPTLHSNSHKKVVEMRIKGGPNDVMTDILVTESVPVPVPVSVSSVVPESEVIGDVITPKADYNI